MSVYRYSGVLTSLNIAGQDIILHPDSLVELPADNPYIQRLLAVGVLKPATGCESNAADGAARSTSKGRRKARRGAK